MARKMLKMFIGSSSESANLAEAIATHLRGQADITAWKRNFFQLGNNTLDTLVAAASEFDLAVFVLGPDDDLQYRGTAGATPRANVLFELGLFMGALGSNRVFGVFSDQKDLLIPNDFAGVTIAKYKSKNPDSPHEDLDLSDYSSCELATKNACDDIRVAILRYKPAPRNAILTDRTVRSIASYLSFKQEEVNIAVDPDDKKAIKQFDDDCHAEAQAILVADGRAVFASREAMCEPATHRLWAQATLRRAEAFGIRRTSHATPISA